MNGVKGKVALVTGSTSGIGYEIAKLFAKEGAKVLVAGRNVERCNSIVQEISEAGGCAKPLLCDLYTETAPQEVVEKAKEAFGGIDILVNNAAWWTNEPFLNVTRENYRKGFNDYIESVFFLSQAVAKSMVEDGRKGKIVHIASTAAYYGENGMSVYCTAKAAIVNLTRCMALELGQYGICVNAVAPGTTVTNHESRPEKILESFRKMSALPELNTAAQIAPAVVFLSGDGADGITGDTLCVDGGCVQIRMPEKLFQDPIL